MIPPLMLQNCHLSSPPGLPSLDLQPQYQNQSKKHKKHIQVVFGIYYCIYDFLRYFMISHPTSKLVSETCLWSV